MTYNSIDFGRIACSWHWDLVRSSVDVSRAGDEKSADSGWIPNFVADLQYDLG